MTQRNPRNSACCHICGGKHGHLTVSVGVRGKPFLSHKGIPLTEERHDSIASSSPEHYLTAASAIVHGNLSWNPTQSGVGRGYLFPAPHIVKLAVCNAIARLAAG